MTSFEGELLVVGCILALRKLLLVSARRPHLIELVEASPVGILAQGRAQSTATGRGYEMPPR